MENLIYYLFVLTIASYVLAFMFYSLKIALGHAKFYKYARALTYLGLAAALTALVLRWVNVGHPPLSNMYESMITLSTFIALAGMFFTFKRPIAILEAGTCVVALITLGVASVYVAETRPLIPALQSYWLHVHVSMAFIGESCFAIAFLLSYLFCFRQYVTGDYSGTPSKSEKVASTTVVFLLPLLFLGLMGAIARHLSSHPMYLERWHHLLWGTVLPASVAVIALIIFTLHNKSSMGAKAQKWLPEPALLDTLTYRAIAVGYPIFTVGAIIFGMVWANQAWGRYWGWDPKETWAFITFLTYSLYLHIRLMRGWKGTWTAIVSIIGFLVTVFTLFGVNYLISSLHSYT